MSIENAKRYMERMRTDEVFRARIQACENPEENWACIKAEGYEFTVPEFKEAQKQIMEEHGTDDTSKWK